MHENREISNTPSASCEGRSVKAHSRTTDTYVLEKSDCAVLPVNRPNKGGQLLAEAGEGRARMKENIEQSHMPPTQSGKGVSQGLDSVRKAARERRQERFTSLLHHLNIDLLRDSFYALKRQALDLAVQGHDDKLAEKLRADLDRYEHSGTAGQSQ
jgi:RNA-directed DNA polymerase